MKPKQLLILVAVLAVLGLIAFIAGRSGGGPKTDTAERRGTKALEGWPINDVKAIEVRSADAVVNLAKPDNLWVVTDRKDFPADPSRVQGLLVKLWETPVVTAFVAGASQNERLSLVDPDGEGDEEKKATKITFKGAGDAEIGHVLIGKDSPPKSGGPGANPMAGGGGKTGRFLRTSKDSEEVLEVANNFSETLSSGWPFNFGAIDAEPGTWLNKTDFIKVAKIKSIAVNYRDGDKESYALDRESDTGDYVLEGEIPPGKVLDGSKVSSLKTVLQNASFEDLLTDEQVAEIDEAKATESVLTTFEGFTYTILMGAKDEEENVIPIKFTVAGEFPQERTVEAGVEETEEEKTKADQEFADKLKENQDKLTTEKALEGHWFTLSSYRVDSLLKSRPDLLKDEEKEEAAEAGEPPASLAKPPVVPELPPGIGQGINLPEGAGAVSAPVAVPPLGGGEKPTATTPPIAIPPAPAPAPEEETGEEDGVDADAADDTSGDTEAEATTSSEEAAPTTAEEGE